MTIKITLLLILAGLSGAACKYRPVKNRSDFNLPVQKIEKLSYKASSISKYGDQIDVYNYRSKLLYYQKKYWYCILNGKTGFLQLFNVDDPAITDSLMIPAKDGGSSLLETRNDSLIIYSPERSSVEIYTLKKDRFIFLNEIRLPSYDPTYFFLRHNFFEFLADSQHVSLLLSYAIHNSPKTSYKDKAGNFLLLTAGETAAKKMGGYPADYFESMKYYYKPIFTSDGVAAIYYTFELNDSVYKIDRSGKRLAAGSLGNDNFIRFNWKKETDLAYVRKYTASTERTERIFYTKDHNLVILKKLPAKEIGGNSPYKYYVLDTALHITYTDTIRHYCYPWFISDFKKGFLLLGDSLKSAWYYETN